MDHYMDTGAMTAIHYSLSAKRIYSFSVIISQSTYPSGVMFNGSYASELKTIEQSGYWLQYNSEGGDYGVIACGEIGPDDISAELYIYDTDHRCYLILKNNLKNILDPTPTYKLNAKYYVDVVEYTTTKTQQT